MANPVPTRPQNLLDLDVPDGTEAGDVLLALFLSAPVSAAPAGWEHVRSVAANAAPTVAGDPAPTHLHAYVRTATGDEPASYRWDFTQRDAAVGTIMRYPAATPVSPVSRADSITAGHSWAVGSPPSQVADIDGTTVVVYAGGTDTPTYQAPQTLVPPLGADRAFHGTFYTTYGTPTRHAAWGVLVAERPVSRGQTDGLGSAHSAGGAGFNRRAAILVRLRHEFAPDGPTLTVPEDGDTRDLESGPTFAWRFNDQDPADVQSAYAFRRDDGSGDEWWDAATGTWVATEVWNASALTTLTFPPGVWSNTATYSWSVATRDLAGNTGDYAEPFLVSGGEPPTVAVVAPAGTVDGTARPLVEWDYDGGSPQTRADVRVYNAVRAGQPGFSPDGDEPAVFQTGWENGDHTARKVGVALDDGDWVAFVRVRNAAGVTTDWASRPFAVAVAAPDAPEVAAVADNGDARVRLEVAGQGEGWWAGSERFQVEASDDGTTWVPVGLPVWADADRAAVVFDYTARSRVPRTYRARTVADADGRDVEGHAGATATAALELVEWWLTDLTDPAGQVGLFVEDEPAFFSRTAEEGEFQPLGRRNPVVVSGVRHGERVEFNALFFDQASFDRFEALLDRQRPVQMRDDMGNAWRMWISQPRDAELMSTADRVDRPMRRVVVRAVEVD